MGKTDYLMMINGNKILKFGTGECFIGSALIMKYDRKGLGFLSGDEFDEASKEDLCTKGDYAFIVATHTDKAHIHNHIIFNFTNISVTKKFRNFFLSSLVVRHLSDTLCLEHGLSVIKPKQYRDQ